MAVQGQAHLDRALHPSLYYKKDLHSLPSIHLVSAQPRKDEEWAQFALGFLHLSIISLTHLFIYIPSFIQHVYVYVFSSCLGLGSLKKQILGETRTWVQVVH